MIDYHIWYLHIISTVNENSDEWIFGTDVDRVIKTSMLIFDTIGLITPQCYYELITYTSCYREDILSKKYKVISKDIIQYVSNILTALEVLNNYLIHKMLIEDNIPPTDILNKSDDLIIYDTIWRSLRR